MDKNKIINFDFEGWPEEKMDIRDIIKALGAEKKEIDGKPCWVIEESELLDTFPSVLVDDGMGYGVDENKIIACSVGIDANEKYVCNFFRDVELPYSEIWVSLGVTPGLVVELNGKSWMLDGHIEETKDGYVFSAKEWTYFDEEHKVKLGKSRKIASGLLQTLKKIK